MSNVRTKRGTIAILTGGGDVPGLNPAIRAITVRALRDGYRVLGIRRGWAGLIELDGGTGRPDGDCVVELSEEIVNKIGRTGGTFIHTSRTRPSHVPRANVPEHLRDRYPDLFFLIPGYGAQGGAARIAATLLDRAGGTVNSSRGILTAWKKAGAQADFARAARDEAIRMRNDITAAIPPIVG